MACGIKAKGVLDLGLLISDCPATTAAVFTRNRLAAAPVVLSRKLVRTRSQFRAIVVNSGNANACTGLQGMAAARDMQKQTAEALDIQTNEVLVASTGVIGVPLPIHTVGVGIRKAAESAHRDGLLDFSTAILTTDRGIKTARRTVVIGNQRVTLVGCTKGAGMIAPNMATTLSFIATDAACEQTVLRELLANGCAQSFNALTVDGDTSTNDMIAIMANGKATTLRSKRAQFAFGQALTELLTELATALIGDGEGVHHVVRIEVRGAKSDRAAQSIARTIANSPLVKTAIAGHDPNWGRILCAAGNANVPLVAKDIRLEIAGLEVVNDGMAAPRWAETEPAVARAMAQPNYPIVLTVGHGNGSAHYLACDLSHDYININANYRS